MLILSRKKGEVIMIGDIAVGVTRISGGRVTLGITAPPNVRIVRSEIEHLPPKKPRPYGEPDNAAGEPCYRYGCKGTIASSDDGTYCPLCGWDSERDDS